MRIALSLLAVVFCLVEARVVFEETFPSADFLDRWDLSNWKKDSGEQGKWIWGPGPFFGDEIEDSGIVTSEDSKFYAISAKFDEIFSNDEGEDLYMQLQVRFPQMIDCGGGYIKLLRSGYDPEEFSGETPYSIMFGPDFCGNTRRVHAILNDEDRNLEGKSEVPATSDRVSHTYRLHIAPDNTYEIWVDGDSKQQGKINENWGFENSKMIADPEASMPEDWDSIEFIDDPEDEKPEGYDDIPEFVEDPEAVQPEDWDEEVDGDWEAPEIRNPEFQGPWTPRKIKNPSYDGVWKAPMIDNPDYVPFLDPFKRGEIEGVGIEIWQVTSGTVFDNIIVTTDLESIEKFTADTYEKNVEAELEMIRNEKGPSDSPPAGDVDIEDFEFDEEL